eukprot:gnl/Dysnectes_brevis/1277_a1432_1300.p1 GENE.gnl/Dysnectes_brevis/1277_a1432_1300~~gnl/Dysnectes_brevis/1277_a1432_1300.p1  ORF type:complete len:494 (+),score=135.35 gnl/Dysnectes_brevis/1277_a1432_1300:148-1629(+)
MTARLDSGCHQLAIMSGDGALRVWDTSNNFLLQEMASSAFITEKWNVLSFSNDTVSGKRRKSHAKENRILLGSLNGKIAAWDLSRKELKTSTDSHQSAVTSIISTPLGIVSASSDGSVFRWTPDLTVSARATGPSGPGHLSWGHQGLIHAAGTQIRLLGPSLGIQTSTTLAGTVMTLSSDKGGEITVATTGSPLLTVYDKDLNPARRHVCPDLPLGLGAGSVAWGRDWAVVFQQERSDPAMVIRGEGIMTAAASGPSLAICRRPVLRPDVHRLPVRYGTEHSLAPPPQLITGAGRPADMAMRRTPKGLKLSLTAPAPKKAAAAGDGESDAAAPTGHSSALLLSQALAAGDEQMLADIITGTPAQVIIPTVKELPAPHLAALIRRLATLMESRTAGHAAPWVKAALVHRSSALMSSSEGLAALGLARHALKVRLARFDSCTALFSRMQLLDWTVGRSRSLGEAVQTVSLFEGEGLEVEEEEEDRYSEDGSDDFM